MVQQSVTAAQLPAPTSEGICGTTPMGAEMQVLSGHFTPEMWWHPSPGEEHPRAVEEHPRAVEGHPMAVEEGYPRAVEEGYPRAVEEGHPRAMEEHPSAKEDPEVVRDAI